MVNDNAKAIIRLITFSLGGLIIFGSHITMLLFGLAPEHQMAHAIANLIGGSLMVINYMMGK